MQEKDTLNESLLYMAIEMGEKSWKLLFSSGAVKHNGQLRVYQRRIEGNDDVGLGEAVNKAKERFKLGEGVSVVSCYEAGQDGFWPHRRLEALGIVNRVVESVSIEVNRRYRRTKTDQLDVRKLLEMLVRSLLKLQGVRPALNPGGTGLERISGVTAQGNFSITRGNRVGWIKERSDGSTHCSGFGGSAALDPPYIFVACPGLLRSDPWAV